MSPRHLLAREGVGGDGRDDRSMGRRSGSEGCARWPDGGSVCGSPEVEGKIVKDVPEVLFVCVHNAGRSQMAAGLLDHHAAGRVHVRSAGSTPADEVDPAVVAAMREVGIDISKEFPKELMTDVVEAADVVVTMGCRDACPVFPGKRYIDWDLPDPSGKSIEEVRPIRDEIDRRVRDLLDTL